MSLKADVELKGLRALQRHLKVDDPLLRPKGRLLLA